MSRVLLLATVAALAVGLVVVAAGSAGDAPDVRTERAADDEQEERSAPATPTDGPFALAATRPESPSQRDVPRTYDRPRATHEGGGVQLRQRMREDTRRARFRAYFLDDLAERLGVTNVEIRRGIRRAYGSLRDDPAQIDPRTATGKELATLQTRFASRLGMELKVEPPAILAAVRAELIDGLRHLVERRVITKTARARAVDCFDDPAACDVDLLRASLPNGLF